MQKPRILIVEDHKDFREAVRHYLEINRVDAHMLEASSGEEGVLIAHKVKPRVVIMDFSLGGINGIEAAQQIKEHNPKCSIIMLTMFDPREVTRTDNGRFIKRFIGKGDLNDELLPTVNKLLRHVTV
jgi:DNA-binding NarL/FixJ family response regulator